MLFNKISGILFLILAISIMFLGDINKVNDLIVFYSNLIIANIWFATMRP